MTSAPCCNVPPQGVGGEDAGVEFQTVAVDVPQDKVGGDTVVLPHGRQGVRADHSPAPGAARAENATQLVLGTSRRGRLARFLTGPGAGETVTALSGDIDVHRVTHERAGRGTLLPSRRRTLSTAARLIAGPVAGWCCRCCSPPASHRCGATADGATDRAARQIEAVDLVGAGDAFVAGYLSALLCGADIPARLHRAVTTAAFAVATRGDWEGLPTRDELDLFDEPDGTTIR